MKRKLLILALLAVILEIVIAACSHDECSSFKDQADKDNCFVDKAVNLKNLDLESCDRLTDSQRKEFCISQISIRQDNHKNCNLLTTPYWEDICFHTIAVNTSNFDLCSRLSDSSSWNDCYEKIAVKD